MPAWEDQDEDQPERARAVPLKWVPEQSAQPCGCDPGCKPIPHVCREHLVREEALDILEAIIYASDGCQGHAACNHSMEPWQRARALLSTHRWSGEGS